VALAEHNLGFATVIFCEIIAGGMSEAMNSELIDQIYECAFVPESWVDVLGDCAKIAGARFGWMFVSNGRIRRWSASTEAARTGLGPYFASGYVDRAPRMKRLLEARPSGFLTDLDIYTPEELERDPDVLAFRQERGLGWSASTTISLPTEDTFGLVLEREYARGLVERERIAKLDELRSHLARSALIAARLQMERACIAGETLAALGLPALTLNEAGKVLHANSMVSEISSYIQWRALNRVTLTDPAAARILQGAIEAIGHAKGGVRSFPVRDKDCEARLIAHVIPIRLSARDIFSRCAAALVLTPLIAPEAPPVELVQSLFDLTPAEARVARNLASGKTPQEIAAGNGVSLNTIRTHIRHILEKTGCNRQVDIVSLLTAISTTPLTRPA
jgi:DNA-binding CsgD family transcriptional regulator